MSKMSLEKLTNIKKKMRRSHVRNLYLFLKQMTFNEVWHHMDHTKNICSVNDKEVDPQT